MPPKSRRATTHASAFGELVRSHRQTLRLSLRAFAAAAGMDPGNASRIERGRVPPPHARSVLRRIATALQIPRQSVDYQQFLDMAAAEGGRLPQDLASGDKLASRLPVLFRALRANPLTDEQFERLIAAISDRARPVALTSADVQARVSKIEDSIRHRGVRRLALFGSVRRNTARPDSDVDLLVEFEPGEKTYRNLHALGELLEDALTRRVELVTQESLSPFLRQQVLNEALDVLGPA